MTAPTLAALQRRAAALSLATNESHHVIESPDYPADSPHRLTVASDTDLADWFHFSIREYSTRIRHTYTDGIEEEYA